MRLVYPHDYNGDTCGDEDSANAENVAGKMRIYYPRLAEDAMNIALKSSDSTLAENIEAAKLYGICVPKCPAPGEIVCKPHSLPAGPFRATRSDRRPVPVGHTHAPRATSMTARGYCPQARTSAKFN